MQKVTPPCTVSAFLEKGVLSPDEFILAGDKLISEYRLFEWRGSTPKERQPCFPLDKQFLVLSCVLVDADDHFDKAIDIHIIYDEHYRTPRVCLTGWGKSYEELKPEFVFEVINQDNSHISVTVGGHHSACVSSATVHPCINAAGMKKIIDDLTSQGVEPEVDKYLLIFLKFLMASVIPFIASDFDVGGLDSAIRKRC